MNVRDAEDLWLACLCEAPQYLNYSKVGEIHLSRRAQRIYHAIRACFDEGFRFIGPELLTVRGFDSSDISGIEKRIGKIHAPGTIQLAEQRLLEVWRRHRLHEIYTAAAKVAIEQGENDAVALIQQKTVELRLDSADTAMESIFVHAKRYFAHLRAKLDGKAPQDIRSGFDQLDLACSFWKPAQMTAIGGRTSHGKSTLTMQLLVGMAMAGIPCVYYSVEDEPSIPTTRVLAAIADNYQAILRLRYPKFTHEHVNLAESEAYLLLQKLPLWIEHVPNNRAQDVAAKMQQATRKHGVRIFAIDYVQTMNFDDFRDRRSGIIQALKVTKAAAACVGAHLIVCSQLNEREIEKRTDKIPTKNDFKEAGEIEAMSENCVIVHRPNKKSGKPLGDSQIGLNPHEQVEFLVEKAKEGAVGVCYAWWNTVRASFVANSPFDE